MRRSLLCLAALAVVGLGAQTALADYPYGNYGSTYAPNYGNQMNNYYYGNSYGGASGTGYSGGYGGYYGGWRGVNYPGGGESFDAAARRIRAAHSPYRYYTHPLSLQNGPPVDADYYGWGW